MNEVYEAPLGCKLHSTRDHYLWAREFCKIAAEQDFDPADEECVEWVAAWMANAMMAGDDDRHRTIRKTSWAYRTEQRVKNKWFDFKFRMSRLFKPRPAQLTAVDDNV